MNFSTASFERRAGLIFAATASAPALYLTWSTFRPAFWPEVFLGAGFGAAIWNVINQDRNARSLSAIDLLLVAVTGFAAMAADGASLREEAIFAGCRVIVLGGALGALAFAYAQLRDQAGISPADVKLIAVLSIALPLAMSAYAIASACIVAVSYAAFLERARGGALSGRQHVPTTAIIAGTFFLFWLGYRLF